MKLLCLISGGIDSPVAGYLMLKKGHDVDFVHFDNYPFTDGSPLKKSKELAQHIAKKLKKKLTFYVIPHGKNLTEFGRKCPHKIMCLLCRRSMLRTSEKLAKKIKADALLTGEALGSVASQTLDNLYTEHQAIKIPVIRPLIAFNKQEIINIAREIGTYDISIQPGHCCTAVPNRPETHADPEEIKIAEEDINLKKLVNESLKGLKTITI